MGLNASSSANLINISMLVFATIVQVVAKCANTIVVLSALSAIRLMFYVMNGIQHVLQIASLKLIVLSIVF